MKSPLSFISTTVLSMIVVLSAPAYQALAQTEIESDPQTVSSSGDLICDCYAQREGSSNQYMGFARGVVSPAYYNSAHGKTYVYEFGQLICAKKFGRQLYTGVCSTPEQREFRRLHPPRDY